MKPKIKGVGLPFDAQFSSCSNIKPVEFEWSLTEGDYLVHTDDGMFYEPESSFAKEKRFGWLCESSDIIPNVIDFVKEKYNILFDYYHRIFTHDSRLLDLDSRFVYCPNASNYPWIPLNEWKIYTKSKICSMHCSPKQFTTGHLYRHTVAKQAIESGYDVFGGVHGTKRTVVDPKNPWLTKADGLRDYMFSIIIENGNYDSYYTEKITDCFATGTVPVYWGTPDIGNYFNNDGIIVLDDKFDIKSLTPELYASKLDTVKDNFERVQKLESSDDQIFDLIQRI